MRGGEMASPYLHYHDSFGRFLERRVLLSCLKRVPRAPQWATRHADLLFNHYWCTSSPSINRAGGARRHSNSYKLSKEQLPLACLWYFDLCCDCPSYIDYSWFAFLHGFRAYVREVLLSRHATCDYLAARREAATLLASLRLRRAMSPLESWRFQQPRTMASASAALTALALPVHAVIKHITVMCVA
ncbi:hypothetical protein POTOM_041097 [Populus tomentosa]|uniref:Uncharacterized protein n=1 Tax=Populus tomentosa TaxID=118781 RepID=A0A8X7YLZ7_POPTO|nr:hypothetical protein POTOM_041097 [Populus tomentosa]